MGGEGCLGPVLQGAADATHQTHSPTSEATRAHRLTQKLDLQALSNPSCALKAQSETQENPKYPILGLAGRRPALA